MLVLVQWRSFGYFFLSLYIRFYVLHTFVSFCNLCIFVFNKPTRCSWAVTFITALLDYSTCFGCFLYPSSGVQQLYMQPLAQVRIGRPPFYVAEFKLWSSDVYLCQRLHIQLYSWWWVQEAPETCRVVKKCSNKGHCPAASCWFVKYWYVMHGTMNLKKKRHGTWCRPGKSWFFRPLSHPVFFWFASYLTAGRYRFVQKCKVEPWWQKIRESCRLFFV